MSATGHIHSKNASVKVVCGAGDIILSAHGNSVDVDYNADDIECSAFGDSSHTFIQGLTNGTFSYNGWWAGSDTTDVSDSVAACLMALVGNSSACTAMFWLSPAGSAAGSLCYVGCVNVQATPISVPTDGIATMNANFTMRAGSITACADSVWS
jgi:hypothetical protein